MKILVSNDDGIGAHGLSALAEALRSLGEVWVVAPDRERSAISHAISLHEPLRVKKLDARTFSVNGTPTDCVYVALHHLLSDPPDVVVSGINHGPNLGNDVIYSGTVAAAMEGALFGHFAIAVSLCLPDHAPDHSIGAPPLAPEDFATAAEFTRGLVLATSGAHGFRPGTLLNVNVPLVPRAEVRGYKLCQLGYTDWSDTVTARVDPRGKEYLWIGGQRNGRDDISDSDINAISLGYVSITPLHYDLTERGAFAAVRRITLPGFPTSSDDLG